MKARSKKTLGYDERYKHKLNMLGRGQGMMKIVGILLVVGAVLRLFGRSTPSTVAFLLAGAVFAALLVLVAIELHQDRVLNDIAAKEWESMRRNENR